MNYNSGTNHPKFIDLTGTTSGELTILEYVLVQEKYQSVWKWKCRCSCGNYTYTRTREFLKENPVKSCASCGRKRMAKTNTLPNNESEKNRVYRNYKRSAVERGYPFQLEFNTLLFLMEQNCHYCGQPPQLTSTLTRNGVDRKDNDLGYTTDNVVPCCKECNRMKLDMSHDEFLAQVKKIQTFLNI